jgi:ABC-2 type transport system ATP-binding protein
MTHITVENLSKIYRVAARDPGLGGAFRGLFRRRHREIVALDSVSFALQRGELLGFIGPNGAGKSTTIKILSGILRPSTGRCTVGGLVPWESRIAHVARIGVVFGQRTQLWWDLPIEESFDLLRDIYRVDPKRFASAKERLVDMLKIANVLDTPMRQLSLGQRMRCEIAAALLHGPDVLFLDEPTIGLDVVSKGRLREFLRTLNAERGTTLLLTTHDLQDIEALCHRVIVIDHGTLVFDGDLADLHRHGGSTRTLVVDLVDEAPPISVPGAITKRVEGPRQWLSFPSDASAAPLVAAVAASYDVADLSIQEPDIEDVIRDLYAR